MSEKKFKNEQKLEAIYFSENEVIRRGCADCIDIEIVMENGQMAGVPWALVEYKDRIAKYNLAICEGVELKTK